MMRAGIVGIAGYTGQELAALLLAHPHLELAGVYGSDASDGRAVGELCGSLRGTTRLTAKTASVAAIAGDGIETVFLATPHEASAMLAPGLLDSGIRVVDLSAAFRLKDAALYPEFYGFHHPAPALIDEAVYGLPELGRDSLRGARLIAAPGCYPTSVIVPTTPLRRADLLAPDRPLVVDSTSGVTGAGRQPSPRTVFAEVSQSPYGVLAHRHGPEMEQALGGRVIFTPHLGPYARGICSTIHAELMPGTTARDIHSCLHAAFGDEPFVRLLPEGVWPSVAGVERTNFVDIGLAVSERDRHLIVVSCIDNLTKGAAGQAVQACNAAMGWDERLGLPTGASRG
ncbi:MAG: N-acetyl-gamma-glutamyl-phosphate reductase [Planctomycetota bacterium]